MAELKIGGNNVKSLMYKDKDVSGSQMLESGTILLFLGHSNWAERRLGLYIDGLKPYGSITCKAFGVEKDLKNISQIGVEVINSNNSIEYNVIDISDLKNGPCNVNGKNITVKLEGNKFTFKNNGSTYYISILVEVNK